MLSFEKLARLFADITDENCKTKILFLVCLFSASRLIYICIAFGLTAGVAKVMSNIMLRLLMKMLREADILMRRLVFLEIPTRVL